MFVPVDRQGFRSFVFPLFIVAPLTTHPKSHDSRSKSFEMRKAKTWQRSRGLAAAAAARASEV
eukprot:884918-Amphidinium_carterae.1